MSSRPASESSFRALLLTEKNDPSLVFTPMNEDIQAPGNLCCDGKFAQNSKLSDDIKLASCSKGRVWYDDIACEYQYFAMHADTLPVLINLWSGKWD